MNTLNFNNKPELIETIKDRSVSKITIKFGENKKLILPKYILELIRIYAKNDRFFIKNLLSSEKDFMYFIHEILKYQNK